ncbi:MAG: Bacterial polymerase, alpha chain terminal domain, partial [Bacteroidota bacterium]
QQMDTRILSWGLASPALRALLSLNINTVEDLLSYSRKEVAATHGMGDTGMQKISAGLEALGIAWD